MKPNRNETERQQARAENALFEAIMSLESVEECRHFLKDLCTPAELQALVDRWQVVEYLEEGLPSAQVSIQGDGDHFEATVVSAAFAGKTMVQQHQMVYAALGDLMQGAVHALALRTFTPEQWEKQIPVQ